MGMSNSVSHMIFFISACIVATLLVGVMTQTVYSLSSGIKTKQDRLVEEMKSEITILNDPNSMPYNSSTKTLILYVKNTGSSVMDHNQSDVIINGEMISSTNLSMSIYDGSSFWETTKVLEITVNSLNLTQGDHYAKVTTHTGVSDEIEFRL